MTIEEMELVSIGDRLRVGQLEIVVRDKVFQYGDWFIDTDHGQFNISVCARNIEEESNDQKILR